MTDADSAGAGRSGSDLTSQWIVAIVTSAIVGFVMAMIAAVVRDAFDLTSPTAGALATVFLFALEIVAAVPSFTVYANRTAAVLGQRLPGLPTLTWYALHVLFGIVLGAVVALTEMGTEPSPYEPPERSVVAGIFIGGAIAGALIGVVIGGLQALVLRKAARAVGAWVAWSTLGGASFSLFALALYIDPSPNLWYQLQAQALGFVIAIVAGMALLPAVYRLNPR
jgi:hypothetical protein